MKPWPKFIRQIDNGNTVWQYWMFFDVSVLKTVTLRYKTQNGSGRTIYCKSNTEPDVSIANDSSKWELANLLPESSGGWVTGTIDVSNYKYLGLCSRHGNNIIYEIVSVT